MFQPRCGRWGSWSGSRQWWFADVAYCMGTVLGLTKPDILSCCIRVFGGLRAPSTRAGFIARNPKPLNSKPSRLVAFEGFEVTYARGILLFATAAVLVLNMTEKHKDDSDQPCVYIHTCIRTYTPLNRPSTLNPIVVFIQTSVNAAG